MAILKQKRKKFSLDRSPDDMLIDRYDWLERLFLGERDFGVNVTERLDFGPR